MSGDRDGNRLDVLQYIFIAKTNQLPACCLDPLLSRLIAIVSMVVIAAVDFHDQTTFHAGEVDDKRLNRKLTSKLQSTQSPATQCVPKQRLGLGLPGAQVTGTSGCFW